MSNKKIIGVTVGTTKPRANFAQTDPKKSDYIENRPVAKTEAMTQPVGVDENGDLWTVPQSEGADGGHYVPTVRDNGNGTMTISFSASKDGMVTVDPVTVILPAGADGAYVVAIDERGGDDTKTTYKMCFSDGSGYDFDVYHGRDGADGEDGVGVASVVQTTTSTADGGENIITVTLTNGNKSTFAVKNGSKGNTGAAGADGKDGTNGTNGKDGKSAYSYAQGGGYAGTESQFSADLAAIPDKVDKSYMVSVFEELKTALENADIDGAVAVLDEAILDMATLA